MQPQYSVLPYQLWQEAVDRPGSFFRVPIQFSTLPRSVLPYIDTLSIATVIEESAYIDYDYSAAYSHFYSRAFSPPSRYCTRYLFFRQSFTEISALNDVECRTSFAGYMVVWPTDPPTLGRTVLPMPPVDGSDLITTSAKYVAHVAGFDLELDSAMFASKDHAVSACSSVATWLATDLLHRRFDLRTCASTEFTLLATNSDPKWGRPFPQVHGLDVMQITRALHQLEYGPTVYPFSERTGLSRTTAKFKGILYGYITSGIPILMLGEMSGRGTHTLLAVGLKVHRRPVAPNPKAAPSFAQNIASILAHDDRWGQFAELEPVNNLPDQTALQVKYYDATTGDEAPPSVFLVDAFIIPLPTDVVLTSDYAHTLGIAQLRKDAESHGLPELGGPFRTYLCESVRLKASALNWSDIPDRISGIEQSAMSKWVWVTEAYRGNVSSPSEDKPIGRVFIDSTQLSFARRHLLLGGYIKDAPH